MTKTYTIATAHDMLIATVPDGQDIAAAVAHEAEEAGVAFDQYEITTGLTLTDDPTETDEIVFSGARMGNITDEDGIGRLYAVKRLDEAAERLKRMRRSDAELDTYFGGRAAYLRALRVDLKEEKDRLAHGDTTELFGKQSVADWAAQREGVIQQLELTLAANL